MRLTTTTVTIAALVLALAASLTLQYAVPEEGNGKSATAKTDVESYARDSRLIGYAEVEAAGKDSPGAAVLRWWQQLQLGADPDRLAGEYLFSVRPDTDVLERQLTQLAYVFAETRPKLVDARIDGDRAHVAVVMSRIPPGEGPDAETQTFRSFELARFGGAWRMADNDYLDERYAAEREYLAAQEE